ncbi:MAG: phosphoenolpyruvate synthase [Acidimicrobiia bacterium]
MDPYVVALADIDANSVSLVGGKGAHLGVLSRLDGIRVPPGFCVTTTAFARGLDGEVTAAITSRVRAGVAYAVRSSATAEDAPLASFAGQHDTVLHVVGVDALLAAIEQCWASLYNEHAVEYRRRSGVAEDDVAMAVVVQEMVEAIASGLLFTADPLSGHRKTAVVEAVFGLGDALVSGRVLPDRYLVRDGAPTAAQSTLTSSQVAELVALGRRIEAHFGSPQDIEWCLDDDGFAIVQSRPITALFPIPPRADDTNRIYISVGHQQMMTDAMRPLGYSLFQMTALPPMFEAAGRLFVDATAQLGVAASRDALLELFGRSDPLVTDAVKTVLDRGFLPLSDSSTPPPSGRPPEPSEPLATDRGIVVELMDMIRTSIAGLATAIAPLTGTALLDFVRADIGELKRLLFEPRSHQVIMAGMESTWWLQDHLDEWLGERSAVDTLAQSLWNNVTSEMGLALLDVADAIRPYPDVVALLEAVAADDTTFVDRLPGPAASALNWYLNEYGMRCVGEIDITRPRWAEQPAALIPSILTNVRHFESGEAKRRFERGEREAAEKEREVLERLRTLPDGEAKAAETKRMIDRVRTFCGYREFPKFGMISRYFVYKQALLREADRLVAAGVVRERDDIFWLTYAELEEAVRTGHVDAAFVAERRRQFRHNKALTPPRVLTSDGEALTGSYRRGDVPAGALVGLAVSNGVVEGRARVVENMVDADVEPGDVLVTTFTDPSWTPVLVHVAGLVTEVGGVMTHGAVIAREYGLPAVVGVPRATVLIRDGQRIRVDGTNGYVEIVTA